MSLCTDVPKEQTSMAFQLGFDTVAKAEVLEQTDTVSDMDQDLEQRDRLSATHTRSTAGIWDREEMDSTRPSFSGSGVTTTFVSNKNTIALSPYHRQSDSHTWKNLLVPCERSHWIAIVGITALWTLSAQSAKLFTSSPGGGLEIVHRNDTILPLQKASPAKQFPAPAPLFLDAYVAPEARQSDAKPHQAFQEASLIPQQLVLTGMPGRIDELPASIRANLEHTINMSPGLTVRYLGDLDCGTYLRENYDKEISEIYQHEARGRYRGDLCRAAVLTREGGFYTDLDVQLRVPIHALIDSSTTFMSAYTADNAIFNALVAAAPGCPIMNRTLEEIKSWQRGNRNALELGTTSGLMGPVTLTRALHHIVKHDCPGVQVSQRRARLQWDCGNHVLRLYEEKHLDCSNRPQDCPGERATSDFDGLRYGLFSPGSSAALVGWPRLEACKENGCNTGGWNIR